MTCEFKEGDQIITTANQDGLPPGAIGVIYSTNYSDILVNFYGSKIRSEDWEADEWYDQENDPGPLWFMNKGSFKLLYEEVPYNPEQQPVEEDDL